MTCANSTRWPIPLRRAKWLYLGVFLLLTTMFTMYHTRTGRETLQTVGFELSLFHTCLTPPRGVHRGFKRLKASDVEVTPGVNVIGLVFFGRRELVKILDCYLKKNLKENGGLLDRVIFAVNTEHEEDLAYLEELLLTSPSYSKHVAKVKYKGYIGSWEAVSEPDSIYVKIDDDIVALTSEHVFVEDNTIPGLVQRILDNPQYFAVSANVVNNPALSWVHNRMRLYEPYYPEMEQPKNLPPISWRASELPKYTGPYGGPDGFASDGTTAAPYKGHRWLPVRSPAGEQYDMTLTPASTLTCDAFGPSLKNWAAAAQSHYSFLQHLEQDNTWRYRFDIWDYNYKRLSINFFTIRGRDILDVFPFPQPSDEDYLTVRRPKELRRHVVVDGTGLAVHFAFNPQYTVHDGRGVAWTDALGRYGAYAREMVCPTT